jgi:hypothetical protein
LVKGEHTAATVAIHWNDVVRSFEYTDGHLVGKTTDSVPSKCSVNWELQSTLAASRIELPAIRFYMPYMAHVAQRALGAFMSTQGVTGQTKSCEAYKPVPQLGENECTVIAKSQ